jgi:hypothetical protein
MWGKTFYILNNCSVHYLDRSVNEADGFFKEYKTVFMPSQIKIYNRKVYKVTASEGLSVIESSDLKSKQEILNLKKEISFYV